MLLPETLFKIFVMIIWKVSLLVESLQKRYKFSLTFTIAKGAATRKSKYN